MIPALTRLGLDQILKRLATAQTPAEVDAELATMRRLALDALQIGRSRAAVFGMSDAERLEHFGQHAPADAPVNAFDDHVLAALNWLLPWSGFSIDNRGRMFGGYWAPGKRDTPYAIPFEQIVALDRIFPLKSRHVLELGCFEGLFTASLCALGATVTAIDGRIENVVKTLVRCWAYDHTPQVHLWDLEKTPPAGLALGCDLLHHVGVLYHLSDPVAHLRGLLPHVREALLLDTHIATPEQATADYDIGDRRVRCFPYREALVSVSPFSGLVPVARWLLLDDLHAVLREFGFTAVHDETIEVQRNGKRLKLLIARK